MGVNQSVSPTLFGDHRASCAVEHCSWPVLMVILREEHFLFYDSSYRIRTPYEDKRIEVVSVFCRDL